MDESGEAVLQEILANSSDNFVSKSKKNLTSTAPEGEGPAESKDSHAQWALGANGRFTPVGATAEKLPAGVYEPFASPTSWGLERLDIASDGIYVLPDMATTVVLEEAEKFWNSESKYRKHGLLYKRGILLWGPPGSGKTVAVKLLINELVRKDGIVLLVGNVGMATVCIKAIRRIEPDRNLIVVFEDIDEIINYNGEAAVLSMLDGENNVDNILNVATTNYPERLGARIINRPSRFDRRVMVGMPNDQARKAYLEKATAGGLQGEELEKWVKDTDGLSIAHLRELVAAVYCLDQPYDGKEGAVTRLNEMMKPVKAGPDGFRRKTVGFRDEEEYNDYD